jgi:hypothetical protein
VNSLCSRNARPKKALVGRAQWGTHPSHPGDNVNERAWRDHLWSLAAALLTAFLSLLLEYSACIPHEGTIKVAVVTDLR